MPNQLLPCEQDALRYFLASDYKNAIQDFETRDIAFTDPKRKKKTLCYLLWSWHFRILGGEYTSISKNLKQILVNDKDALKSDPYVYSLFLFLKANNRFYKGHQEKARKHIIDAKKYIKKHSKRYGISLLEILILHLEGKILFRLQDLAGSIKVLLEAIEKLFQEEQICDLQFMVGKAVNHIANCLTESGEIEDALALYAAAQRIYEKYQHTLPKEHLYYGILYADWALCHLRNHASTKPKERTNEQTIFPEVKRLISQAEKIFNAIYAPLSAHRYYATILRVQSRLAKEEGNQEDKVIQLLLDKIEMRRRIYDIDYHHTIARAFNNMARAYLRKGDLNNAHQRAVSALKAAHNKLITKVSDFLERDGSPPELNQVNSKTEILRAMTTLVEIAFLKFDQSKDSKHIASVYNLLSNALKFIKKVLEDLDFRESKYILIKQTRPIHEHAFHLLYTVYADENLANELEEKYNIDKGKIFSIIRQNKANILEEAMRHTVRNLEIETREQQHISTVDLIDELKNFGSELNAYAQGNGSILTLIEIIKKIKKSYSPQEKEQTNPLIDLYKDEDITLENIQATLAEEGAGIISYFQGKNKLFAILISDWEVQVEMLATNPIEVSLLCREEKNAFLVQLRKELPNYRNQLSDAPERLDAKKAEYDFIQIAHGLYTKLLKPFEERLSPLNGLYIVPDGDLWELPFEALISDTDLQTSEEGFGNQKPFYNRLNYLVRQKIVSYHFSILLWYKIHRSAKANKNYFSSNFHLIFGEIATEENMKEILEQWWEHLDQSKWLDVNEFPIWGMKDATPGEVLKNLFLCRYAIIYAHGGKENASKRYPFRLKFNDQCKITPRDVRFVKQDFEHTQLLIINGCSTGIGPNREGEGVIALNRAFFEKRIPNLIYTLTDLERYFSDFFIKSFTEKAFIEAPLLPFAKALNVTKKEISYLEKYTPIDWSSYAFLGDQIDKAGPI